MRASMEGAEALADDAAKNLVKEEIEMRTTLAEAAKLAAEADAAEASAKEALAMRQKAETAAAASRAKKTAAADEVARLTEELRLLEEKKAAQVRRARARGCHGRTPRA